MIDYFNNFNHLDNQLFRAVGLEDKELVLKLIKKGADINSSYLCFGEDIGWTPILYAVQLNNIEIVSILINNGANVNPKNINGWTPLHAVMRLENPSEILLMLFKAGADITVKYAGETPIEFAKRFNNGNQEVINVYNSYFLDKMPEIGIG